MKYHEYKGIDSFWEGLNNLNINLSNDQMQQFIDYYEMLIEYNKVMNLTAITDFNEVIHKHFIDSLSLVKVLSLESERVLDLGTGAGFPGIPIKIAFPEVEIVLLDSLNKRVNFLNEVIQKLNLNKISTVHGRAEDFGRSDKYRETFDLCVSRAVAKLSSLSEYCLPYIKPGGYFVSYKSGQVKDEMVLAEKALKILGANIEKVSTFTLPDTDIERSLVVIHKTTKTPNKYPRTAGKPTKDPL